MTKRQSDNLSPITDAFRLGTRSPESCHWYADRQAFEAAIRHAHALGVAGTSIRAVGFEERSGSGAWVVIES